MHFGVLGKALKLRKGGGDRSFEDIELQLNPIVRGSEERKL